LNQQFRSRQFPAGNPLANALVIIVGIIVISLSLALGVFVFVGIMGFLFIMGAVMAVRNWWLGRRFGRQAERDSGSPGARQPNAPQIIEGEYRKIDERDEGQPGA
jgi:hypothetical protein